MESKIQNPPKSLASIQKETKKLKFKMASDPMVGSLLRTLAASKPKSSFLELGTGTGLATSWILDGMCENSQLITVDNDAKLLDVANKILGSDQRIKILNKDADQFLEESCQKKERFDFIFADTWGGKYRFLEEALNILNPHGLYIIDDMLPQPNWPTDHPVKVKSLLNDLENRKDFYITKLEWSCGVVICTKKF